MLPEPIELPEQRAVFFPELVGRGPPPQREQRWKAYYHDANGKRRQIGLYDTQEAAAHAVNAAIRRAGLVGKRRTNAGVDGHLVPRETHKRRGGKRRRDEPAASSSCARRRPRGGHSS